MVSPTSSPPSEAAPAAAPGFDAGGVREVFALAAPVVLTQLSSTAMGVVDSAIVGRLGATPLAAVGLGNVLLWTLFSFFYGTGSGVQTFVAQSDGAGRPRECGAWAWQALYAVVPAVALCVAVLWPLAGGILARLGASPALEDAAAAYVTARLPGEVALAAVMVFGAFFRGFGDTKTPLYVSLAANVVNAILDYGLVFGELGLPELGVRGAGVATAIGNTIGALVLLAALRQRRVDERYVTHPVTPSLPAIRRFLRTSAPMGGQWFVPMTSFLVFTALVARMGDAEMAASQAFLMLLSLSFMQAVGISVAASTLVGRYVGARNPEGAARSLRSSLVLGAVLCGSVAVLLVAVPDALLSLFTHDPAVHALGRPLLLVGAIFQLFDAVAIIIEGALRGAGDTRWPFLLSTALAWGVFLPAAWVGGIALGGGLTGAWIGGLFYVALFAALLARRFASGAWREIEI